MGRNSRRRDHHEFDLDNLVNKSMSRGMREITRGEKLAFKILNEDIRTSSDKIVNVINVFFKC